MFRRIVPVLALASALAVAVGSIPSAAVAGTTDGNWWYSGYHVAQAHAAGWTGKGVKIAVIDQQIDPSLPVFKGANLTVDKKPLCTNDDASVIGSSKESNYHGSSIGALLVGNGQGPGSIAGIAPGAHVTFYGWGVDGTPCDDDRKSLATGISRALSDGANIISISSVQGIVSDAVVNQVARAVAQGVIIVAAQPDTAKDKLKMYPNSFNGVIAVNGMDSAGILMKDANTGKLNEQLGTNVVAAGVNINLPYANTIGDGSSYAAPLVAGMLADVWQKYPNATGNQLTRSLIHNANKVQGADSEWYGSGIASMTNMLRVNPSRYADSNPLWGKPAAEPTRKEVRAFETAKPTHRDASGSADSSTVTRAGTGGSGWSIPLISGGVLLVVVAVVLWLLWRRRRLVRGENYGG